MIHHFSPELTLQLTLFEFYWDICTERLVQLLTFKYRRNYMKERITKKVFIQKMSQNQTSSGTSSPVQRCIKLQPSTQHGGILSYTADLYENQHELWPNGEKIGIFLSTPCQCSIVALRWVQVETWNFLPFFPDNLAGTLIHADNQCFWVDIRRKGCNVAEPIQCQI